MSQLGGWMSMMMTKKHSGTLNKQPSQDLDGTTQNKEDIIGLDCQWAKCELSARRGLDCSRSAPDCSLTKTSKTEDEKQLCPRQCSSSGLSAVKARTVRRQNLRKHTMENSSGLDCSQQRRTVRVLGADCPRLC